MQDGDAKKTSFESTTLFHLCCLAIILTHSTCTQTTNYPGTKLVGVPFKLRKRMKNSQCENRFCLHKTEIRTDGETPQKLFGKGLSPGEHSLAAGRTEISYGKRISLRQ